MTRRWRDAVVRPPTLLFVASTALFGLLVGDSGCSRTPKPGNVVRPDAPRAATPQEYLDAAVRTLRNRTTASGHDQLDATRSRDAIDSLNAYLKSLGRATPFQPLDAQSRGWLRSSLHLDSNDLTEIESPVFTPRDGLYLDLSFQLGDVARAFDLEGLPTLERAQASFDWVIRHVALKERVRQVNFSAEEDGTLPSEFVLHLLGYGTARERGFIFLSILHHLGIDGCLVAIPSDKGIPSFWLPGVLVQKEERIMGSARVPAGIYLFDTRLGTALPSRNANLGARLEDILREPKALRGRSSPVPDEKVIPERISKAEVYLICPAGALSPRMKYLEKKLGEGKLALDVPAMKAMQKRFAEFTRAPVRFWLKAEVPKSQAELTWLKEAHKAAEPIPAWRAKYPTQLDPVLYEVVDGPFRARHAAMVQIPRALLMRGRVDDATSRLLQAQNEMQRYEEDCLAEMRKIGAAELSRATDAWCAKLREAKLRLGSSRDDSDDRPASPESQEESRPDIAKLVSPAHPVMRHLMFRVAKDIFSKESTYLLCLCTHEKAEQLQRKLGTADKEAQTEARDAWTNAFERWRTHAADHGLTVQRFKKRLAELLAFTNLARVGPGDKSQAEIALALYELLALDLSRSVTASVLQAHACDNAGRRGAREILQQRLRDFDALEKSGHLTTFKDYPSRISIYKDGVVGYTSPDNVAWLRATLKFHLDRLQKK